MSPLDPKDEYTSLRGEMLHRFQKIYDAEKYGIGSIVILIGYFLTTDEKEFHALPLLELLVLLLAIFVRNEFLMIYRLGTYIALFIEGVASAKWHRMSRCTRVCLEAVDATHKPERGFPLWYSWGSDAMQVALVLAFLLSASWFAMGSETLPWELKAIIIISVLLFIANLYFLYQLFWGVKEETKHTEKNWIICREAWGASFPDPFEREVPS